MTKRNIGALFGTMLLIVAAVVVALRERWQPLPLPDVPVAASPAEVRVKAVERNPVAAVVTAAFLNKTTSSAGELWYNISQ